ncbi:MAG TPA: hypothetical protein PKC44_09055 [Agitococcus sp.]|nr:hypothetical protein [Agitococcus sp.]
MNNFIDTMACALFLFSWIAGVVLAKGFWWTLLAVFCPFYAWYLIVERVLVMTGVAV